MQGTGGTTNLTAHDYTVVGTVPADYRPTTAIPFVCNALGGTTEYFGRVHPNGNIDIYNPTANATNYMAFSVAYPHI